MSRTKYEFTVAVKYPKLSLVKVRMKCALGLRCYVSPADTIDTIKGY